MTSSASCCRYESATTLTWAQVATSPLTATNIDLIEFSGGDIPFSFTTNQPLSLHFSSVTFSSNDPQWNFSTGWVWSQGALVQTMSGEVSPTTNTAAVSPGDVASTSFVVDAPATGEHNVTLTGSVTLTSASPDPGIDTPSISDIAFGPLSSQSPSLVKVRFDPTRPIADTVEIGSWNAHTGGGGTAVMNDLGTESDQTACDGWFSGSIVLKAGSYDVLIRARSTATGKAGPFIRRSITVF